MTKKTKKKKLSEKELLLKKQREECTLCDKQGFIAVKKEDRWVGVPCKCTKIYEPPIQLVTAYKE